FEMCCEPLGGRLACSFRDIDARKQAETAVVAEPGGVAELQRIGAHLRALRRSGESGAAAGPLARRLEHLELLAGAAAGGTPRAIEAFDCGLAVRGACDAAVPLARASRIALNGPPLRRLPKVAGAPAAFRRALDLLLGECVAAAGEGGE